ncbi:hypothetical protein SDJN02_13171, partial [Cucurbita argyrosperma subsp. argyrosperma]
MVEPIGSDMQVSGSGKRNNIQPLDISPYPSSVISVEFSYKAWRKRQPHPSNGELSKVSYSLSSVPHIRTRKVFNSTCSSQSRYCHRTRKDSRPAILVGS